jgi:hypothetical protein
MVRPARLVKAAQIARDTEVRQSPNGVRFATFGETGLADLDLDRMLQTVPTAITAALKANTYYFVPLAMREAVLDVETQDSGLLDPAQLPQDPQRPGDPQLPGDHARREDPASEPSAMVASAYSEELYDAAICHRNLDLDQGRRAVFISTRLMGDRFALSFEFFINVAHAFVERSGVPASFADPVWRQALRGVRGETSIDAWETRNLAFGRPANAPPEPAPPLSRRNRASMGDRPCAPAQQRSFARAAEQFSRQPALEEPAQTGALADSDGPHHNERALYLEAAFSDALAIYLLSLALDFDYSELREREYPLLHPSALAERLRLVADLFPPNPGYEFALRYRRRA